MIHKTHGLHFGPCLVCGMEVLLPQTASNRFATTFFLTFAGSQMRPFMAMYIPVGNDCTPPMAQPMLNPASEPRKRARLSASVVTTVLFKLVASTWPSARRCP